MCNSLATYLDTSCNKCDGIHIEAKAAKKREKRRITCYYFYVRRMSSEDFFLPVHLAKVSRIDHMVHNWAAQEHKDHMEFTMPRDRKIEMKRKAMRGNLKSSGFDVV